MTHRYYWEIVNKKKEKPIHPGEDDEVIPEEIRGNHYDSWKEIAKITHTTTDTVKAIVYRYLREETRSTHGAKEGA